MLKLPFNPLQTLQPHLSNQYAPTVSRGQARENILNTPPDELCRSTRNQCQEGAISFVLDIKPKPAPASRLGFHIYRPEELHLSLHHGGSAFAFGPCG